VSETVTAIYEGGVLRLLEPLSVPERARVQLRIIAQISEEEEREKVRRILLEAGVIQPHPAAGSVQPVTEAELEKAARDLAAAGPLSEQILAEREGR
jgi:predicted DNA-binding antitoxin AbrB/MazE fold protein